MFVRNFIFLAAAAFSPLRETCAMGEIVGENDKVLFPSESSRVDADIAFLQEYEDPLISARGGRAISGSSSPIVDTTTSRKRSQCRGSVTHLSANEATVLKSHRGYGASPYPSEYNCRWLVIPKACDLGIECSLGTRRNLRRSRFNKCSGADYLRVLGYQGSLDSFYCGTDGPIITFKGDNAIALVFNSEERRNDDDLQRQGLFGLAGFNCNIVCKPRKEEKSDDGIQDDDIDDNKAKEETTKRPGFTTARPGVTTDRPNKKSTTLGPLPQGTTSARPGSNNSPKPKCICGEARQARIVCPTGHNCTAGLGGIPWQAALVNRGSSQPWCGGSLINSRFVLTAAHCLISKKASKLQVILGDHDWTTKSEAREYRYGITEMIRHSRFGKVAQYDFDFALLRLDRPVDFARSPRIRPVCLPEQDENPARLVGHSGTASGWGVVDPSKPNAQARRLQQVVVDIISRSECRGKYPLNPVTDNMICAQTNGKDACYGDSGGPFTVRDSQFGGHSVLEGVISWGKSCAQARWPGVYARVRAVLPWIRENARDGDYCIKDERFVRARTLFEDGTEEEEYVDVDSVTFPDGT